MTSEVFSGGDGFGGTADEFLEAILKWSQERFGDGEFIRAQMSYFAEFGKVVHEDPTFEGRMNYYLTLFAFDRLVAEHTPVQTPYSWYVDEVLSGRVSLTVDAVSRLKNLALYRHSFFEVRQVSGASMTLLDLWTGERWNLVPKADELFVGFRKGEVVQTYLFPESASSNQAFLSLGYIIHPSTVRTLLRKELSGTRTCKSQDFLGKFRHFAQKNLRYLRHRHVSASTIYALEAR